MFVTTLVVIFLIPFAIPQMGASLTFTFTVLLTLLAWLLLKWDRLKKVEPMLGAGDILLGTTIVVGNFARNIVQNSAFGLVDQWVTFVGLCIAFYGLRRIRFFILPLAYISILIGGYWAENNFPQVTSLEFWQANLMADMMTALGISTTVSGNVVTISGGAFPLALEIAGPCTGIKGMLAFGALSSMAVLDIKVSTKKLLIILGIGFAGAFLINLLRLATIFITAAYVGPDLALQVHTYLGYSLFLAWVLIFWAMAFRYLLPAVATSVTLPGSVSGQDPGVSLPGCA